MKSLGLILLLLGLCLAAFSLMVSNVGNHAIDAWAAQAAQPPSVTDAIMQSRQTPPVEPEHRRNGVWLGAGLLALVVLLIGSLLFIMHGGAEFLRQWRLARKRPSPRPRQPIPQAPYTTDWAEFPHVPTLRYLPEVDDEQSLDSWD